MRIEARLPRDRWLTGTIAVYAVDGSVLLEPAPARGKADNLNAVRHDNANRDPTRRGGDHPYGRYQVVRVVRDKLPTRSYGAAFLLLDPQSGDAWLAKDNGRAGLAIHGGERAPNGGLRATEGCLRVSNQTARILADLVGPELAAGAVVDYECKPPEVASDAGATEGEST